MLAQDEETVELRETFTSLQQEVEAKTKKLKKVNGAQTEAAAVVAMKTENLCDLTSLFQTLTPDPDSKDTPPPTPPPPKAGGCRFTHPSLSLHFPSILFYPHTSSANLFVQSR